MLPFVAALSLNLLAAAESLRVAEKVVWVELHLEILETGDG